MAAAAAASVATTWRTRAAHSTPVIDACGFIAWSVSLLASGPDWRQKCGSDERHAPCQRIRQDIARHGTARVGFARSPARARQREFRIRGVVALSGRAATP
jgi:hypothetical protein